MENRILKEITDSVIDKTLFCTKEVLTSREVARYMGVSISYVYKLIHERIIPHYKPNGKICFFNRKEVENWLLSNPVATATELTDRANKILLEGKGAAL